MKNLKIFVVLAITTCLVYSCSTSRNSSRSRSKSGKSTITGVTPNIKNPSRGVINASGDGLSPGISSSNGAGSEENARNIANNTISRANAAFSTPLVKFDSFTNEDFVNKSAVSEVMEIRMSRIAQKKTSNQKIKDYATMILNDHEQIQNELKELSVNKNITLPDSINSGLSSIKTSAGRLNETSEGTFDFEYVQMMIEDHQNTIKLFTAGSQSKDPEIRAFAIKHLPMLKKHLSEAQELTKEVRPKQKSN